MIQTETSKTDRFYNQNLPWITIEKQKVDSSGTVIEKEYISVGGKELTEVKKIVDKLRE